MATLKHTDKASFDDTVIRATTPVLVDFHADWCAPCKALAPTLEAVASENEGALAVVKVNIDDNPELATKYGIQKIPTLILFEAGEARVEVTGVVAKDVLLQKIQPFIGRPAVN